MASCSPAKVSITTEAACNQLHSVTEGRKQVIVLQLESPFRVLFSVQAHACHFTTFYKNKSSHRNFLVDRAKSRSDICVWVQAAILKAEVTGGLWKRHHLV